MSYNLANMTAPMKERMLRTWKTARRLGRFPTYLRESRKTPPAKREVVYIVEDANWSIKWDGIHITRNLNEMGRKASIDISSTFHAGKILHFGSAYVFETQAFRPTSLKNKLIVTFFHGKYGDDPGTDRRLDLLQENIGRIDAVAVSTNIMKKRFLDMGIQENKLFLIPIGVKLETYRPLPDETRMAKRRALNIPDDAFVIGSFQKDGQGWGEGLEPKHIKGPDTFLEVIEKLTQTRKVFCLLSGPARGYIKQGLDRLGVGYHHAFFKNPDDVAALYQLLDAYAVTSREEGGPKAILESLASGVPLVTTDVGMAGDVLKGHNCGFICKIGDAEDIADKLAQIADNPELAKSLKENGLKRARLYDWAYVAQACEDMYKTLESNA